MTLVDFETKAIHLRPEYPPKPVSLAIKYPDENTYRLFAWGHPSGNNCKEGQARAEYLRASKGRYPMCFQHGEFDTEVAEVHWGIPAPVFGRWHDTKFLLALFNPHAPTFSLKPSAQTILAIPPEEQDKMFDWIVAHIPAARKKPTTAGAYISECPYNIVKPYHKGDLIRTGKLFEYLYPIIVQLGMLDAYHRELRVMPILKENAKEGMKMNTDKLSKDVVMMKKGIEATDAWLRRRLGIDNIDSDRQLGKALYNKSVVKEVYFTKKGQISVSKKYLTIDRFRDKRVFHALQYRNQMSTSVNMFAEPWLELVSNSKDGRTLHPNWIQVPSSTVADNQKNGARSLRIICVKPNFLNIPKKWKRAITAGYEHPAFLNTPRFKLPQLPYMRTYCLPDNRQIWGKRDINQQELRLFGHFEEGPVMEGFLTDPKFDIHENVREEAEIQLVAAMLRKSFDRDSAKTCVFGRIYGQGIPGLMDALQLIEEDKEVAKIIQRAINTAVPSINELDKMIKDMAHDTSCDPRGEPIKTWGGRLYYCEERKFVEKFGRTMDFAYKLLNYLLQGSGADVIKEILIRFAAHVKRIGRFVVTVYDEINFSTPNKKSMLNDQKILRDCILSIETDVPMLSDGEEGPNWGTLNKYAF